MIGAHESPETLVKIKNDQLLVVFNFSPLIFVCIAILWSLCTWLYAALYSITFDISVKCVSSHAKPMAMALWAHQISAFHERSMLC